MAARACRCRSQLNYSDHAVIKRPDENDRARTLVSEEAVTLELGYVIIKKTWNWIKRRCVRRDLSHFRVKPAGVLLLSDSEEFAYDLPFLVAERHWSEWRSRFLAW